MPAVLGVGISVTCLAIRLGDGEHKLESAPTTVMVVDPRISDTELAAINAAAVTREYRVQPHLGTFATCSFLSWSDAILQIIALYPLSTGEDQIQPCPLIFN